MAALKDEGAAIRHAERDLAFCVARFGLHRPMQLGSLFAA